MSGLISPILEQAGFLKRKTADVVEQWVAQLDGATQYWQLSDPIEVLEGFTLKFRVSNIGVNKSGYLFCSEASTLFAIFTAYNGYISTGSTTNMLLAVDGQSPDVIIHDGGVFDVTVSILGTSSFQKLASRFNTTRLLEGYMSNIMVYNALGTLVNEIPLTNKSQGATQLPTVGTVSATMANYTEAVWKKKVAL